MHTPTTQNALIFGFTLAVLFEVKKEPEPLVIIAAGVVGLVVSSLG